MLVDCDHLDLHQVANFAHIANAADIAGIEFADVAQAIAPGQDFDKCAEVLDGGDLALINAADLHLFGDGFNPALGCLCTCCIGVRDVDGAIVLDLDLGAGAFLDALDILAAWPDEQTDLLGIDAGGQQAWSVGRNLFLRLRQGGEHGAQDLATGNAGLLEGFADDLLADAVDLEIELDTSDSQAGSGNLEIHVAVVVFVALDVSEGDMMVAFFHQADGDAGDWVDDWHTRVHEGKGATADAGHAGAAVGFENVGNQPDGVGEDLGGGDDAAE